MPELLDTPEAALGELAPQDGPALPEDSDYLGPSGQGTLPENLRTKLKSICREFSKRELYPRLWQIRAAREQRFFYAGSQHLLWNADDMSYQIADRGVATGSTAANEPDLFKSFNIYLGYAKSFMATFCQNTAAVRFEPEDPLADVDIGAAKEAEKMKRVVEKFNDPRQLQVQIARLLWTDGRVLAYTRYVTDGQRFGFDQQGSPRGREVIDVYGVLESKLSLTARDLHDAPYVQISGEFEITTLKAKFPNAADQIMAGAHGNEEELVARTARLAVAESTQSQSQQGDSLAHLGTFDRFWLRPSAFLALPKDDPDREQLLESFPDGAYVGFCGNAYCESRNESMDKHIKVMHALPGDGQNRPSFGASEVALQQSFNDCMSLAENTFRFCIPAKWVDEDVVDIAAIEKQRASPGQYYPAERKTGEALGDAFYAESPAQFPPEFMEFLEMVQGPLSQFMTSQQPALFGQQMADQKTARGFQMARDQALGVMGLVWLPFKQFYAAVLLDAVREAAANRTENVSAVVPAGGKKGATEPLEVDIDALSGNLLCVPQSDENFPESYTQKQNKFSMLIEGAQQNPVLAQLLMHPDNLALTRDMIGLEELVIPGADSRDKQLQEITQLLQEVPIPPSPQEMVAAAQQHAEQATMAQVSGGQAPPPPNPLDLMKPSVEVDPVMDDHAAEFAEVKRWINSPEGQKAKGANPPGFMNVRLHGIEHQKLMAPPMPMQP